MLRRKIGRLPAEIAQTGGMAARRAVRTYAQTVYTSQPQFPCFHRPCRLGEPQMAPSAAPLAWSRQIEDQEFGLTVTARAGQPQLGFFTDGSAIAFHQLRAIDIEFPAYQLYPSVAAGLEREFQSLAAVQQRRVHTGILVDGRRALAPVVRGYQPQLILLFLGRECPVLVAGLQSFCLGQKPDLQQ